MASLAKRPNGKWRARITIPGGGQRARHFDRKVDAEDWIAQQVVRLRDGSWVDPHRGRRTFGDYAKTWQANQVHHRESTAKVTAARLRIHLLPRFGEIPIAAIQRSDVQSWVRSLELAPSYVEGLYRLMAQVMLAAVEDQVIASSPCRRIQLPEVVGRRLTIPTVEEIAAVHAHATDAGKAVIAIGAGTGMRIGELCGLTVDRVDFLRRTIRVDQQLVRAPVPYLGPVKTRASNRTLPVPQDVIDVLSSRMEGRAAEGIVLLNGAGRPWVRTDFSHQWERWCAKAGVASFRFHDLRHHYASTLIAAGQSVKVVQERLGHSSATTTLDVYGHLWPADEDATRAAVAPLLQVLAGERNGTG